MLGPCHVHPALGPCHVHPRWALTVSPGCDRGRWPVHAMCGAACCVGCGPLPKRRYLPCRVGGRTRSWVCADTVCNFTQSLAIDPHGKDSHAPPLWEVPRREVCVMREDTLLRVSKRTEDTLKIHLCEDTRPGPNEEVYLHTKIHRGPNEDVYLHTKIHRGPNEEVYLEDTPV